MPKLTASKEEVKGQPPMPPGIYTVKLSGFKPKLSKKGDSVNLNPQMEVINHPEFNNRKVFDSLNTKAKFTWKPFAAAFGITVVEDAQGNIEFPGDWDGPDDPKLCEQWKYRGPLLGATGQVELTEDPILDPITGLASVDKMGNTTQNRVKKYIDATGNNAMTTST
jgi:hypothetical protein